MGKIRVVVAVIIWMMVMAFPTVISSAASCGETVRQDTESVLKAVDYDQDQKVADLLAPPATANAPSGYTFTEISNKRVEIANRDGKNFLDVTEEEALSELKRENTQNMFLGDAFVRVQEEIGPIIQKIVDNAIGAGDKEAAALTQKIVQNKEKLLLGLAYIEKLYHFNMGEKNIRDVLLYEPGTYGVQTDVLDWLIKIGGSGGSVLKIANNTKVFGWGKIFWDVTSSSNLDAFLEENRKKWIPDISMDEWILQAGNAYIVEKCSSQDQSANSGLYSRMYQDPALQTHILPLLTVSEDSIYVIVNSTTITYGIVDCYVDRKLKDTDPARYIEKREEFRQDLERTAGQQKEFIDLWYRLAKPEVKGLLSSNRLVLDSLRIYADTTISASTEWSAKSGKDASLGVREFFSPLNLYAAYMFADGMASGTGVRYYVSKALTERGLATYAHELTHLLVSSMMLNGYGARDGMQAEVYARGMFEPYELNDPPVFNLNLIYDRAANNERLHNAVPGRFQNEADLQGYMRGIMDVVYTLDYAEAEAVIARTPEQKKKWFHKLEQVEDTKSRSNQGDEGSKHYLDSVRELTLDEAAELNTLDDLIQNSIVASRYEVNGTQTTGTLTSNGYYVVPLFSANYAGVQNDNGVSGDVMIRRQAFELLAEYGYYGGMVPYISNQYRDDARAEKTILSDTYILKKVFGGTYGTMADFKRAMFQKRIERTGELKPITISWNNRSVTIRSFAALQELMEEAVASDLKNVTVTSNGSNNIRAQETQVEQLKAAVFRAYLFLTKDFQDSIYGDGQEPEPVEPTPAPTEIPEGTPSPAPTIVPTVSPVTTPSPSPTIVPTGSPVTTPTPTLVPTKSPGATPSSAPTIVPTLVPTVSPTALPSISPTSKPSSGVSNGGGSAVPGAGGSQPDGGKNPVTVPKVVKAEKILARVSSARTSQTIRWNPVSSADGYYIYGAKAKAKYKRLRTAGKKVLKWKHKALKKGRQYKYYVAAYKVLNGKRVILSKSLPVYSITKGGKNGNPAKIRLKKSSIRVKSRKTVRLKAKVTGRKLRKADKKIRYVSANPAVARISGKGVITGVKRGTCYVYCIARNGLTKKVKVKVKG